MTVAMKPPETHDTMVDIRVGNNEANAESQISSGAYSWLDCKNGYWTDKLLLDNPSCLYEPLHQKPDGKDFETVNVNCRKRLHGRFVTIL